MYTLSFIRYTKPSFSFSYPQSFNTTPNCCKVPFINGTLMPQCFCSYNPPSTSITKFISDHPFLSMLETKCQTIQDLKQIHANLIKTGLSKDIIAVSRVLAFCATSPARDMNYALRVFNHVEEPNLFSWNTIIRGFSQSSTPHVAISLFLEMLESSNAEPDKLTYPSVFKAYTQLGLAKDGAQLHGRVVKLGLEHDPFVRNTVIHMYASCGLLGYALKLFDEDNDLDVVAWNSMIIGLAKCGEVEECWRLFSKMPFRNEVSWSSMISCYVRNGKWNEALDLFNGMQEKERGIRPNKRMFVSLLNACAKLGALEQGKWIHKQIRKDNDIELNVIVLTAIIDMYCKCGDIEAARQVFEAAPRKGLSCWNAMIMGLAMNGFENEAIELFTKLMSTNLGPDPVSFVSVLTACSHSGQVDKARVFFKMLAETYEIEPLIEHYGCMVDVLGRARLVEEAVEVVKSMPMKPDAAIWGSLLSACSSYGYVEVAKWAAENLILSDPHDTSAHVLMSNVYASTGHFEKAMEERDMMKKKMHKGREPGLSLIQVNGVVEEFVAGGIWHSEAVMVEV